jgi:hypothetical protein
MKQHNLDFIIDGGCYEKVKAITNPYGFNDGLYYHIWDNTAEAVDFFPIRTVIFDEIKNTRYHQIWSKVAGTGLNSRGRNYFRTMIGDEINETTL